LWNKSQHHHKTGVPYFYEGRGGGVEIECIRRMTSNHETRTRLHHTNRRKPSGQGPLISQSRLLAFGYQGQTPPLRLWPGWLRQIRGNAVATYFAEPPRAILRSRSPTIFRQQAQPPGKSSTSRTEIKRPPSTRPGPIDPGSTFHGYPAFEELAASIRHRNASRSPTRRSSTSRFSKARGVAAARHGPTAEKNHGVDFFPQRLAKSARDSAKARGPGKSQLACFASSPQGRGRPFVEIVKGASRTGRARQKPPSNHRLLHAGAPPPPIFSDSPGMPPTKVRIPRNGFWDQGPSPADIRSNRTSTS